MENPRTKNTLVRKTPQSLFPCVSGMLGSIVHMKCTTRRNYRILHIRSLCFFIASVRLQPYMVTKRFQKGFVTFAIIAFFVVSVLGLSYGMPMDSNGQMSNCPFMGITALCKMNPLEHMNAWQNLFAAIPSKAANPLAALLLLALFAVVFLRDFWNVKKHQPVAIFRQRFREKTFVAHTSLQEAFSSGILNPKLF